MTTNNFADRLNTALDKEHFPPKNKGRIQRLAEMVGLTHKGAGKWINGESKPPAKKYGDLAKKLNVSAQWLKTGEGSMSEINDAISKNHQKAHIIDVPIYDLNSFMSQKKGILNTLQSALPYQGNFFGIILDSEAMSPRFPQGSTIIFDQAHIKDGDFVLVNYDEYPVPIFRQLIIAGQQMYLYAHNPKFDRLILQDKNQILGKLIQAILSFE
jgi:transcriptional regulator with XRE-family HTH domain